MADFLKCDAVGCDHRENVPVISEGMIGKPCPKCRASLLTAEDYSGWAAIVQPMLDLAKSLNLFRDKLPSDNDGAILRVNLHDKKLHISAIDFPPEDPK